jgi:hypothetical protein
MRRESYRSFQESLIPADLEGSGEISRNDKIITSAYSIIRSAFRGFAESKDCTAALEIPLELS